MWYDLLVCCFLLSVIVNLFVTASFVLRAKFHPAVYLLRGKGLVTEISAIRFVGVLVSPIWAFSLLFLALSELGSSLPYV